MRRSERGQRRREETQRVRSEQRFDKELEWGGEGLTPKAQALKEKTDELDFVTFLKYYASKDTISRI